jgi:hypothetical protein
VEFACRFIAVVLSAEFVESGLSWFVSFSFLFGKLSGGVFCLLVISAACKLSAALCFYLFWLVSSLFEVVVSASWKGLYLVFFAVWSVCF